MIPGPDWVVPAIVIAVTALLCDLVLSTALTAISALSRVSIHRMAIESNGADAFVEQLRTPASRARIGAFVARQACLVVILVAVATLARAANWPVPWLVGGLAAIVAVVTVETLSAGAIALLNPRGVLRRLVPVLRIVHAVTLPVSAPLAAVMERAGASELRSEEERDEDQEEEVEAFIQVGEREGLLEADEGKMLRNVVDLGDTLVREIMTPRPDIQAMALATSVGEARRAILDSSHSRMPVYRDNIDNIFGILHLRDLVRAWDEGRDQQPISAYVRPAFYVPETMKVDDLLEQLRTRTNVGLVVDEYGGIAGLVTMEDVMEEIVGDIRDEHDAEEELVRQEADGSWTVSALVHVDTLEEMFGLEVEDRDFDTVGGLVVSSLGRVPTEGETVQFRDLRIDVVKADPRRVYTVRITPPANDAPS
jgi:CBS domain containing-hemolysin-like protein